MSDSAGIVLTQGELNAFHSIDRALYTILVMNLWRDPVDSLHIVALLLWLERVGYKNAVYKVLQLPIILINEIADEAILCLQYINNSRGTSSSSDISSGIDMIPLLHAILEKNISLQFFQINKISALQGVTLVLNDVCMKVLSDMVHKAIVRNVSAQNLAIDLRSFFQHNSCIRARSSLNPQFDAAPDERTMFVTFSKGYHVYEFEIRDFFNTVYENCIQSIWMQDVPPNGQSLFARIVFRSPEIVKKILIGSSTGKTKFTINGKHVWARKFIPRKYRAPAVRTLIRQPPGTGSGPEGSSRST